MDSPDSKSTFKKMGTKQLICMAIDQSELDPILERIKNDYINILQAIEIVKNTLKDSKSLINTYPLKTDVRILSTIDALTAYINQDVERYIKEVYSTAYVTNEFWALLKTDPQNSIIKHCNEQLEYMQHFLKALTQVKEDFEKDIETLKLSLLQPDSSSDEEDEVN